MWISFFLKLGWLTKIHSDKRSALRKKKSRTVYSFLYQIERTIRNILTLLKFKKENFINCKKNRDHNKLFCLLFPMDSNP